MRLKRAMSLKEYRRRRRRAEQLGDELGARSRGRGRRRRRPDRQRPRRRPESREQRRRQRDERVQQRLWSEAVPLGENIRIQAADGYRGAFMELRPGLYLVAELRTQGMEGEFGRKVQVKDVTDEIVRVTDQALDAIFPRRRSQKRADRDEARRRAELARREQEQARRDRERADRERADREAAARATQARALPAPQSQQRALPEPRRSPSLPRGAARWLEADFEDYDDAMSGCCRTCEERRR